MLIVGLFQVGLLTIGVSLDMGELVDETVIVCLFSQGDHLVGLMPVLATCHLLCTFSNCCALYSCCGK